MAISVQLYSKQRNMPSCYIIFSVIHLLVVISLVTNVVCFKNPEVDKCIEFIHQVFIGPRSGHENIQFAFLDLKFNNPKLIENKYAGEYYSYLGQQINQGNVESPEVFSGISNAEAHFDIEYSIQAIKLYRILEPVFGTTSLDAVQHAYKNEEIPVFFDDIAYAKYSYLIHIAKHFGTKCPKDEIYSPEEYCQETYNNVEKRKISNETGESSDFSTKRSRNV